MEKEKPKYKQVRYGIVVALVIGMMVSYMTLPHPVLEQDEDTKSWHIVWQGSLAQAAEADPGNESSWILSIYLHPHQTDIGGYLENSSSNLETNCTDAGLGYANADDTEVDIAHSTSFDIVVRVRGEADHCKVGGVWFDTNLRVTVDGTNLGGTDEVLTLDAGEAKTTANNSDYTFLYMNFFHTKAGAGFTISQDQTIEVGEIFFEAYY